MAYLTTTQWVVRGCRSLHPNLTKGCERRCFPGVNARAMELHTARAERPSVRLLRPEESAARQQHGGGSTLSLAAVVKLKQRAGDPAKFR